MEHTVYKLKFKTGVHFGSGTLSSINCCFCADTLFSAMYIEAIKLGIADEFSDSIKQNKLLFSDSFPFVGERYFIPKPMLYIEPKDAGDSISKKLYKNIKYVPIENIEDYLNGNIDPDVCRLDGLGREYDQISASINKNIGETEPYSVGTFYFSSDSGLYIIVCFETQLEKNMFEEIMESLSYNGIGGKKSGGKGKFEFTSPRKSDNEKFNKFFERKTGRYMLLSTALPQNDEFEEILCGASYLMQKRSGFIDSVGFNADRDIKKCDLYTMQAGSCFEKKFSGDIYDVSGGRGKHPVYRYAKGMFAEV